MAERRIDIYINEQGWMVDVLGFDENDAGWSDHLQLLQRAYSVCAQEHPELLSGESCFTSSAGVWTYTNRVSVIEPIEGVVEVLSTWNVEITKGLLLDVFQHASGGVGGFAVLDSAGTSHRHIPIGDA